MIPYVKYCTISFALCVMLHSISYRHWVKLLKIILTLVLNDTGANWLIRKMVASSSPNLEVTQDGNKMSLRLHNRVMDKTTTFTVGEEYDETQQDGAEMRVSQNDEM